MLFEGNPVTMLWDMGAVLILLINLMLRRDKMMRKIKASVFSIIAVCGFTVNLEAEIIPGLINVVHKKGSDDRGKYDMHYPVLTNKFSNEKIRDKVNAVIKKEVFNNQFCDVNPDNRDMSSEVNVTIHHATPKILSFSIEYYQDCGGAHPNDGSRPYFFDLTTGNEIYMDEDQVDGVKISRVLENQVSDMKVFRNFVIEKFLAGIPKDADSECKSLYTREELSRASFQYTAMDKHLTVSSVYPQVVKACEYQIDIPYSQLKKFTKANSIFEKMIIQSQ
jgi:hypothetical protein